MDVKHDMNMYLRIFSHTLAALECLLAINVLRAQRSQGGHGEEGWWLCCCKRSCTVASYGVSPSTFACFHLLVSSPSLLLVSTSPTWASVVKDCLFQSLNTMILIRSGSHDTLFRAASMVSWFQTIFKIESSEVIFVKCFFPLRN